MERQHTIAVVRSLASAATAAGLVFASWSTPANASAKSDYHGIDVSMLRSSTSVLQGPVNPMRVNSDIFSPRDSKEKDQKTKSPTKGTGSKSKANGSATGTNSASKKASKDGSVTKGTGSKNTASKMATNANNTKNTKEASKARGSATGTKSVSKHGETGANGVLGVQTPPMVNGTQTLAGAVNQQANGVVVKGVESLPSTSTAEAANLMGAGLALIASGGSILVIKRRRK